MIGLALNDEECRMVQKASRQGGNRATERLKFANLVSFCCPSAIAIKNLASSIQDRSNKRDEHEHEYDVARH